MLIHPVAGYWDPTDGIENLGADRVATAICSGKMPLYNHYVAVAILNMRDSSFKKEDLQKYKSNKIVVCVWQSVYNLLSEINHQGDKTSKKQ